MSNKISLSLSTTIKPAEVFTVDGEEFQLLGLEHLSADAENEIAALFARHNAVAAELGYGPPIEKGKALSERLKKLQNRIIEVMTTIPKEVVLKLPMMEKARLFEAVQEKYEAVDDAAPAASDEKGDIVADPAAAAGTDTNADF